MEFEPVVDTIEVPRNSGTDGFLKLIRSILKLGHVQSIHIAGNGKVEYRYLKPIGRKDDQFNPEQLFEDVSPSYLIRNSQMIELRVQDDAHSLEVLHRMMRAARVDGVEPLGWAVGAGSMLVEWLTARSCLSEEHFFPCDSLMGIPVHKDRMLPDESLTLCAGPVRGGEFSETTHSYKIAMVLP
jgi:hypothetical protein